MDQIKIGAFLRELRKEKGLTQEQLAEKFNVAGRTVSRWETGNNLPDLSLLVELADFYDVDIRELIDGERKSEIMDTEIKDTLVHVAEYAENEKNTLLKKVRAVSFAGLICFILFMIVDRTNILPSLPVFDFLTGIMIGVSGGTLFVNVLYLTGLLSKIKPNKSSVWSIILMATILIMIVVFILAIMCSL